MLLFSCPQMMHIAKFLTLDNVGRISWDSYDDDMPKIVIVDEEKIDGEDVIFLASLEKMEEVFRQFGVIYAIPRFGARSLTIVLPYFSVGMNDRVDVPGKIVAARTLARMFEATPHCQGSGPARLVLFDIHAPQERFYFGDSILVDVKSTASIVKHILWLARPNFDAIAFPDANARKRFREVCGSGTGRMEIVCEKVRNPDGTYSMTIREGDPNGKRILLVDDLVMSGKTLITAAALLRERGASGVSAFVAHPVFPKGTHELFNNPDVSGIDQFWVTDSLPHAYAISAGRDTFNWNNTIDESRGGLTVLSLKYLLGDILRLER